MLRYFLTLFALTLVLAISPAYGFTEKEFTEVFKSLDEDGDGRVTHDEYVSQKIFVIYRRIPVNIAQLDDGEVTFEQTKLSREFFDSADKDGNGKLSPVEVTDALQFEMIAQPGKDFFTKEDLRTFMKRIGT